MPQTVRNVFLGVRGPIPHWQALTLINDPTYVEAARALAERMMGDGGGEPEQRIRHGFRLATARIPSQEEAEYSAGCGSAAIEEIIIKTSGPPLPL